MSEKKHQTTHNLSRLRQLVDHLGGSKAKTAEALGYSAGMVTEWYKRGEIPITADLACECLLRRAGNTLKQNEVLVLRAPAEKMEAVSAVVLALKGSVFDALRSDDEFLLVAHVPADVVGSIGAVIVAMGGKMSKGSPSL